MISTEKKKKNKIRVAILLYKPLPKASPVGGEIAILTLLYVLKKIKHISDIEVLSISNKNVEKKISNNLTIKEIKGHTYPERGIRWLLDLLCLFVFGFKPSLLLIEKNRKILNELAKYNPDLLIVPNSFQVKPIINKYKLFNRKAKIIAYTDSPEVLVASFDYLEATSLPTFMKKLIRRLFYNNYIKFNKKVYTDFIKISDMVVVPTEFDKEEIIHLYNIGKNKIFVIPLISYKKSEIKKMNLISKIKKVVFVGACNFWPNLQAIEIIKQKIAPKLKDIEFIIVGKYCKPQRVDNVNVIGEVKNLDSILRDADAFIAPIVSGRGIKTKILTYFLYRKPVIGTSLAFRGYKVKDNYNAIVEDNIDNIWRRIYELNRNRESILRIQKNSIKVLEDFKISKLKQKWTKLLTYGK